MLIKWKNTPSRFRTPRFDTPDQDQTLAFSELMLGVFAGIWIGMALLIYCLLQTTLIPLSDASRWYFLFGLVGFGFAFLLRNRFRLSLLDGVYLNVFAVGPVCLLMFLALNRIGTETYTEQYRIVSFEHNADKFIIELNGKAYNEYLRIRSIPTSSKPASENHIEFTFRDGLFGYKVLMDSRLY